MSVPARIIHYRVVAGARNIAFVGSRSWSDKERIREVMLSLPGPFTVVTGGARGADTLAKEVAEELGFGVTEVLPNWHEWGKRAGPMRNRVIAEMSSAMCAFWDGSSRGTKNAIAEMRRLDKGVFVFLAGDSA